MQPSVRSTNSDAATPSTLVDGWAETSPERFALSDQWGCESWSGRLAARLTWEDIRDRSTALAARLSRLALGPGALVGLCLANGSDWMVAFLAVERAGLTPCCLPVAASASDLAVAVEAAGIEAIITQAIIGPLRPAETVCTVAGGYYRLRYILGFGPGLPDGVTDLASTSRMSSRSVELPTHAGRSRGIVTFERYGEIRRPVLRSYPSLIAATEVLVAALGPERPGETLITLLAPDDLKAIVSGPMLSLMTGCGIEAHGLFSRAGLDRSVLSTRDARVVAPGWMEVALRRHVPACPRLILTNDAPARLPDAEPGLDTVDVLALGESAVLAAPRREGLAAAIETMTGVPAGLRSRLRLRVGLEDGRIHAGGLAAEVSRLPGAVSGKLGGDAIERDAPTPFGFERTSEHVIGILSLA